MIRLARLLPVLLLAACAAGAGDTADLARCRPDDPLPRFTERTEIRLTVTSLVELRREAARRGIPYASRLGGFYARHEDGAVEIWVNSTLRCLHHELRHVVEGHFHD